jgi:hypothetical protein
MIMTAYEKCGPAISEYNNNERYRFKDNRYDIIQ